MKIQIIRADERHRAEIDRLIREAKIGDGMEPGPIRNFWVARVDGRIVGCAGLEFINDRAAVFTHLVVEKALRRQGIGSALIEKRFEAARKRGIEVLTLCTMYYHFNFYKRRGFRTIPRKELPEDIRTFSQFTAKRYMKCAVMINEKVQLNSTAPTGLEQEEHSCLPISRPPSSALSTRFSLSARSRAASAPTRTSRPAT